ncbi:F0F1 ATP synthase subunit A [Exiguobacterium qingdaonense]|uniref:F0F1 ATP synthase subunit A n=1 Tax=Exiguobacterium qingdaonense TaxID=2751251 RepID=UPI001BEC23B5|nr:F0F1 ATP synthase subunit A [Exiguobacterium qingdaonense]
MGHEFPTYSLNFGDYTLYGSWTNVITVLVAALLVFTFAIWGTRRLAMKPTGKQNFMEYFAEFVRGIIASAMDWKTGGRFIGFGMTLILFILFSNLMGLPFNVISGHYLWFNSPTADPYVTLALSTLVVAMSHYYGVKLHGLKHYSTDFVKPVWFLLPIKLIEEFANTLTLGLRLYGNIFAGEIMITIILGLAITAEGALNPLGAIFAVLPMILWQGFSIFIGVIQSYIFLTLAMVYIGHKASAEH